MANLISMLTAVRPTGLWEKVIFKFDNVLGSCALAIILITIIIKLLLLPVDYFNRRSSAKMTEVQTKLAPKMAEIKKKYPDQMMQNQKMQELYKKEGFNPMGSCLTMLIVMIVSVGVFFSLFASLNNIVQYKIVTQYEQLQVAYVEDYVASKGVSISSLTNEEIQNYVIEISNIQDETEKEQVILIAQANVKEKYEEVKESFLWIKNVWIADSPTSSAIPDFKTYAGLAKITLEGEELETAENVYNAVMGNLKATEGVNGYFILAILTGATAFLYQYLLTQKKKKKENFYTQNAPATPNVGSGKAMLIILPIIMVVFTLSYNSIFALYIIISQLVGIATAPLINYLLNKPKKQQSK